MLVEDQLNGLRQQVEKAKEGSRLRTLEPSLDQLRADLRRAKEGDSAPERERIFNATEGLWTLAED
jgi:hypothetical protein